VIELGVALPNEYINLPPLLKLELKSDLGMPSTMGGGGVEGKA
jgi:hypothetical protein